MATFSKLTLSESSSGRPIKVTGTSISASPTQIHIASSTTGVYDEVWIYAQNNHTADVAVRIGFGDVTDPDDIIEYTVKTKGGLYLVVPGLILSGKATPMIVKAAAGTANVISLSGYINRITA